MMKLKNRAADKVIGCIPHQLRHPGNIVRKGERHVHFILKGQILFLGFPSTGNTVTLPALAMRKAQVHAVAGEEGVGIKRKLHTGGVRDRLTKQYHDSGSCW